jgi:hypothetical protein
MDPIHTGPAGLWLFSWYRRHKRGIVAYWKTGMTDLPAEHLKATLSLIEELTHFERYLRGRQDAIQAAILGAPIDYFYRIENLTEKLLIRLLQPEVVEAVIALSKETDCPLKVAFEDLLTMPAVTSVLLLNITKKSLLGKHQEKRGPLGTWETRTKSEHGWYAISRDINWASVLVMLFPRDHDILVKYHEVALKIETFLPTKLNMRLFEQFERIHHAIEEMEREIDDYLSCRENYPSDQEVEEAEINYVVQAARSSYNSIRKDLDLVKAHKAEYFAELHRLFS